MIRNLRSLPVALALLGIGTTHADEPPKPRLGLTAVQSRQAVKIAGESLDELRQKVPGVDKPDADRRQFVVSVVRLDEKSKAPKPAEGEAEGPTKAVVTTYRYLDDTTIYSTVDLATGRTIETSTAQHMQTPLSDGEFEAAKALAREHDEVKALYERFGKRIEVYAQFSQYTPKDEERVHRVVLILFRVDKRDLSAPRPSVDLTTRQVTIARPDDGEDEAEPPRKPKP